MNIDSLKILAITIKWSESVPLEKCANATPTMLN